MKVGVVFEGGGMRCVYTAGVIEAFLEEDFIPDYLVGVSAGASNGASYISKQRGRALRTNMDYLGPDYASVGNWLKTGSYFGMDYLFGTIPQELDPYDWETANSNPCEFAIGTTDCLTGEPVFFYKEDLDDDLLVLRASCSMPVLSQPVTINGREYLDGGASMPIPFEKAFEDGCDYVIVVLTQPRGYRKEPQKGMSAMAVALRKYPGIVETMKVRHDVYNQELKDLTKLEKQGKAFVLAPNSDLPLGRTNNNPENLKVIGDAGYADAKEALPKIREIIARLSAE